MDFQDVPHWQNNKLDRKESSRMGWSDVSISLSGPVVEDLRAHFIERWNFIYDEKYNVRKDVRYSKLTFSQNAAGVVSPQSKPPPPPASQPYQPYRPSSSGYQESQSYGSNQGLNQYPPPPPQTQNTSQGQSNFQGNYVQGYGDYPATRPQNANPYPSQSPPQQMYGQPQQSYGGQQPYFPPPPGSSRDVDNSFEGPGEARGVDVYSSERGGHHHHHQQFEHEAQSMGQKVFGRFEEGKQHLAGNEHHGGIQGRFQEAGMSAQIVRSCTTWSHGISTEHSIANAYINVIGNANHFVYIENQFFITATSDAQKPIKNKIGAAIVERILRAARAGQKFKVIVVIPAVPGFAGDLKDDASLGTRAIMEFQYNSINRGGHSIMESIAREGINPMEYITFYNLRNYDRINVSGSMRDAEQKSGVNYEDAQAQYDEAIELPAEQTREQYGDCTQYQQFQQTITNMYRQQGSRAGEWDSVSECYMLSGRDIRDVPWEGGNYPEIKAFVSEELYVHSKVISLYLCSDTIADKS